MGKQSNKKSRSTKIETSAPPTVPVPEPAQPNQNSSVNESPIDLNKVVNDSQAALSQEKPKRHRRTKAEIEASRGQTGLGNQISTPPVDRTQVFKPAFLMYSEILLAKPLGIDELKLTDAEAEALAQVTSNLMNAFPEYFNASNPKVAAIVGAAAVAIPIGYMKYSIYKSYSKPKRPEPKIENVEPVKEKSSEPLNLAQGNPFS